MSSQASPKRAITRSRVERVDRLGPATRDAMFALFARHYEGAERETFARDLAGKQRVILLLDRAGEVAGFSTIQLLEMTVEGVRRLVVFSGDTVIDQNAWGQKRLQRTFTRFLIQTKLRYPWRRVYWFLISKGYKTYLLMRRNLTSYPNHRGATPSAIQEVMDHVARIKFPEHYDAESGLVVLPENTTVRADVRDLRPEDRVDPDIDFFLERNPEWRQGHELCCLAELRLYELFGAALKYALPRRARRR